MNFKHYNQRQTTLLPYSFDDFISEKHPVRLVDQVVESMNIQPLLKASKQIKHKCLHNLKIYGITPKASVMMMNQTLNPYSSRKSVKKLSKTSRTNRC